jgi:hypothetical protein
MTENLFKTEQEISEFLAARAGPKPGSDYAITSLASFSYKNDELKKKACAYITTFLEEYPTSYGNMPLRVVMLRVAPFLEAAGYIAALEPLMRVRNRLEAELDKDYHTNPEWVVAVRNAIETLQRLRDCRQGT